MLVMRKQMKADCDRYMRGYYFLYAVREIIGLVIPVVSAGLIGDMTNSLIHSNANGIKARIFPLAITIFVQVILAQGEELWMNMHLIRSAAKYQSFLLEKMINKNVSDIRRQTGATVAECIMTDVPAFYFNQGIKKTSWFVYLIYVSVLGIVFYVQRFSILFIFVLMLVASFPMIKSKFFASKLAELVKEEREYEVERSQKEFDLFNMRTFINQNHLTEEECKDYEKNFSAYYEKAGKKKSKLTAIDELLEYISTYGGPLLLIICGSAMVLFDRISIGALMAGYLVFPTITKLYKKIATHIEENHLSEDIFTRIAMLYEGASDEDIESEQIMEAVAQKIKFEDVNFGYPGGADIIQGGNYTFEQGNNYYISGPNGSGKSTIQSLLCGLESPNGGNITDGCNRLLTKKMLRRLISYQEQDPHIFAGTVWENLFVGEDKRKEAEQLLTRICFEKGLDFEVETNGNNLSPGECKKISLARALLKTSSYIVFDEPLNHLDQCGQKVLTEYLDMEKRGVIYSSHQPLVLHKDAVCFNLKQ